MYYGGYELEILKAGADQVPENTDREIQQSNRDLSCLRLEASTLLMDDCDAKIGFLACESVSKPAAALVTDTHNFKTGFL